jgi:malonyl-CoA O-methyltransferase
MCARDLMDMLDIPLPQSMLDIGCGTGSFTQMLAERFPDAQILACDPSQRMLKKARLRNVSNNVEFIYSGIDNLPKGTWDLAASNAALHWAGSPEAVLASLKDRLAPDGTLAFSYFTRNTYPELAQALSLAAGFDVTLASREFASAEEVEDVLSKNFTKVQVQRRVYSLDFENIRELLEHIKLTGTRGAGSQPKLPWTRKLLEKTQSEYLSFFGRIRASYEVVLCTAKQTQSS